MPFPGVGLNYGYERAMRETIPAVRIAIAKALRESYGMKEIEIANQLGIAQAAVSKYLGGRYSKGVGRLVGIIESRGLHRRIVNSIISRKKAEEVAEMVDEAASDPALVKEALKHV
jgi:predicted transcriptional regulator